MSNENGNISENDSDICSSTSSSDSQRDDEETTASYSSLEDEIANVELNTSPSTFLIDLSVTNNKNISDIEVPRSSPITTYNKTTSIHVDDNGNNLPTISTHTSDSDSCSEMLFLKSFISKKSFEHSLKTMKTSNPTFQVPFQLQVPSSNPIQGQGTVRCRRSARL
ncbi:hypothetical protein V9T40_014103 [Parthenolecanium corni]|uniref:Uncharacterized protein n=1 Tax=Parthenolecanium corni TaxID=536013 RepID=A0AAN9TCC6_9HEMI